MADYIPAPDAEFDSWQVNWVTYAAANAAALGGCGPAYSRGRTQAPA